MTDEYKRSDSPLNFIWPFHNYVRTVWNLQPVFNFSNLFRGGCLSCETACRNCHSLIIGLVQVNVF